MSLLPSQPLKGSALIKTACHLYRVSFLTVLPFSVLSVAIYYFIRFEALLIPPSWQSYFHKIAVLTTLLWLPLFGLILAAMDAIAKVQSPSYLQLGVLIAQRFLSLVGSLLSILLLPAVIFGIGIVGYFILLERHMNPTILMTWKITFALLVFAAFVRKIFTPILVITDLNDANTAIDNNEKLIKGYYFRTFLHALYGVCLIVLLAKIPVIVTHYFKFPLLWLEGSSAILLVINISWPIALLLNDKYDLQLRKRLLESNRSSKDNNKKPTAAIPTEPSPKKNNQISF